MKWRGRAKSDNMRDVRGMGKGKKVAAGGGLIVVIIAVIGMLLGKDLSGLASMFNQQQGSAGGQTQAQGPVQTSAADQELLDFAGVVLKDTEDIWHEILTHGDQRYIEPNMQIFDGNVPTACGVQSEAVGPFYCPGDSTIYLELGFFETLSKRLGAGGDFARAYVIAHEVGHHIQNLTGDSDNVRRAQQGKSKAQQNELSVRLELQADFLAGIYAHHAEKRGYLERGDMNEALNAASQIGDDVLTKRATGRQANVETFTHGTGEQRVRWFRKGYETGNVMLMSQLMEWDYRDL